MTRSLGQAIGLLKFNNQELSAFLAFHDAVNPHLSLIAQGHPPDRPVSRSDAPTGAATRPVFVETLAGPAAGLYDHVRREVGLVPLVPRERAIAERLIEELEPTGWLGRPVDDALSKICGCSRTDLLAHFATIRGFNPKPGQQFGAETPAAVPPDLVVTREGDGFAVDLNRSSLPVVKVGRTTGMAASDQQMLVAARMVARAVERRNIATLQIAAEIVFRQSAFLREGEGALLPLGLREIAEAVGVHVSTVSRVVAGLRMDTPRGPLGLREFFSGAVSGLDRPVSAVAVRARIAAMIEAEDPAHPASDADLAARLSGDGVSIARRTVAKYRDALRIPTASARRRGSRPGRE
ncbi:MAG: hypothetical protein B7Z02_17945 [Rhodobacterales bacterium 32-67-9]|nr:MAG: hypothetical protein B7Z02_17945 [Rhodobacterales bacterium 32-67-9]